MVKINKRGWIRIIEAVVAILIIMGLVFVAVDKGEIRGNSGTKIYSAETAILREIQTDATMRNSVLNAEIPVEEGEEEFPSLISEHINSRIPSYLDCTSKICWLNNSCELNDAPEKNTYVSSVAITVNLYKYEPRQIKLFCWTD